MTDELLRSHIDRMRALAASYVADADLLSTAANRSSHADYLLQLMAFEILLKAVCMAHGQQLRKNHSYKALFQGLPAEVQRKVLEQAGHRLGQGERYSNPVTLFDTYQRNFVALRYSYEPYEGLTAAEVRQRGESWVAAGAKTEEATFQFYPEELFGLIVALGGELDGVLTPH